ncbi:hypothetical protein J6590_067253 [Homalodisca vitripennis]|nr:hypothetical protein J6590_067253 [Homalodisca vitripennis]
MSEKISFRPPPSEMNLHNRQLTRGSDPAKAIRGSRILLYVQKALMPQPGLPIAKIAANMSINGPARESVLELWGTRHLARFCECPLVIRCFYCKVEGVFTAKCNCQSENVKPALADDGHTSEDRKDVKRTLRNVISVANPLEGSARGVDTLSVLLDTEETRIKRFLNSELYLFEFRFRGNPPKKQ